MRSLLLTLGLVAVVFPSALHTQPRQDLLRGLSSMTVLIAVDEEARDAGLAPECLRTAVELRLRQSRIPVLDESSVSLSVSVDLVEIAGRGGGYAFAVKLKLREPVYPMRQVLDKVLESDTEPITLGEFFLLRGVPNQAVTWEAAMVGTTPRGTARAFIRDGLLERVDSFANEYLAANAG